MANLVFMGFEVLVNAYFNHVNVWDIAQFTAFVAPSTSVPRNGGSGYALVNSASETSATKSLGGNYAHLFAGVGWMYRAASLPATPTNLDFVFFDGATAQVGWVVSSLGEIIVYRGATTAATELGRTATGVIVAGGAAGTGADYKMIEVEVVFHASAGTVTVKVADTTVLTLTGQNTAPSGTAQANRFRLLMRGNLAARLDDLYINDDSGSAPENTFFGESFVVESIIPNGNGNSSQWVGSDGNSTDNYLLVDDTGNNDTDYVKSGTLNDLDTYAMSNLSNATGTIIGANHYFVARKDDVATRTIASAIRTNSTNYVSANNKTMVGTYAAFVENRLLNPDTSLRFTVSEINALEVGQKVTT